MNTKTLEALATGLEADIPVHLIGAPGTCKTAYVRNLAEKHEVHLEVLIGSMLDPTEVGGRPYLSGDPGKEKYLIAYPDWAIRLRQALDNKQQAWLFLDEFGCSPRSIRAALLRLVAERKLGSLDLSGIRVLAASNPVDMAADGDELDAASANRWMHLDWSPDQSMWAPGFLTGWGKSDEREIPARRIIQAYLHRESSAFLSPPKSSGERAWPSPRSWDYAAKAISRYPISNWIQDAPRTILHGLVGGSADNLITFAQSMDLPSPEDLIASKVWPEGGDKQWVCADGLAGYAAMHKDQVREVFLTVLHGNLREDLQVSFCGRIFKTFEAANGDQSLPYFKEFADISKKIDWLEGKSK